MNTQGISKSKIEQDIHTIGKLSKGQGPGKNELVNDILSRVQFFVANNTLTEVQLNVLSRHIAVIKTTAEDSANGYSTFMHESRLNKTLKSKIKTIKKSFRLGASSPESPESPKSPSVFTQTQQFIASVDEISKEVDQALFSLNIQKLKGLLVQIQALNKGKDRESIQGWIDTQNILMTKPEVQLFTYKFVQQKTYEYETKLIEVLMEVKRRHDNEVVRLRAEFRANHKNVPEIRRRMLIDGLKELKASRAAFDSDDLVWIKFTSSQLENPSKGLSLNWEEIENRFVHIKSAQKNLLFLRIITKIQMFYIYKQEDPHALLKEYREILANINVQLDNIYESLSPWLRETTIFTQAEKDEILGVKTFALSPLYGKIYTLDHVDDIITLIAHCELYRQISPLLRPFEGRLPKSPLGTISILDQDVFDIYIEPTRTRSESDEILRTEVPHVEDESKTPLTDILKIIKEGVKILIANGCDFKKIKKYIDNNTFLISKEENLRHLHVFQLNIKKLQEQEEQRCPYPYLEFSHQVQHIRFNSLEYENKVIEELITLLKLSKLIVHSDVGHYITEKLLPPDLEAIRKSPNDAIKLLQKLSNDISHLLEIEKDSRDSTALSINDKIRHFWKSGQSIKLQRLTISRQLFVFVFTKTAGGKALQEGLHLTEDYINAQENQLHTSETNSTSSSTPHAYAAQEVDKTIMEHNEIFKSYFTLILKCEALKTKIRYKHLYSQESNEQISNVPDSRTKPSLNKPKSRPRIRMTFESAPCITFSRLKTHFIDLINQTGVGYNVAKLQLLDNLFDLFIFAIRPCPEGNDNHKNYYEAQFKHIEKFPQFINTSDKSTFYSDERARHHSCIEIVVYVQKMILEGILENIKHDIYAQSTVNRLSTSLQGYQLAGNDLSMLNLEQQMSWFEQYQITLQGTFKALSDLGNERSNIDPRKKSERMLTPRASLGGDNRPPAIRALHAASNLDLLTTDIEFNQQQAILKKTEKLISDLYIPIKPLRDLFIIQIEKQVFQFLSNGGKIDFNAFQTFFNNEISPFIGIWNDFFIDAENADFLKEIKFKIASFDHQLMERQSALLDKVYQHKKSAKGLQDIQKQLEAIDQNEQQWKEKLNLLRASDQEDVLRKVEKLRTQVKQVEQEAADIIAAREQIEAHMKAKTAYIHDRYSKIVQKLQ